MSEIEAARLQAAVSRLVLSPPAPGTEVSQAGVETAPARIEESAALDELLLRFASVAAASGHEVERHEQLTSRLSAALDALAVGVVICDDSGAEVYRNSAAGGLGTVRPSDVLADEVLKELLVTACAGEEAERSLELFSPYRRNLMIRAYPISGSGGPLGAVAIVEDVSERRRLDAIRRDFVANVSHELKTPVGALSLLAETLDGEEDPENVALLVGRVGMEAERLSRIIDDLLDLSRIEANEGQRTGPVGLTRVLDDAIEPLRATAEGKGITIELDDSAGPSLVVLGDRLDLISALSNLVDNAVKYSERDSCVHVDLTTGAGVVRIAVKDHGIGIPERDRERIFERFYRVDRARSRLTGGTGLGLSIVRHVAANHGGAVEVDSEEGRGSTFTLVLPTGTAPLTRLLGPPDAGFYQSSEVDRG